MSDAPSSKYSFRDVFMMICSAAGLAVLIAGPIYVYGGRDKQIDENTRRIAKLEAADELLTKIDGRMIRIETKLEMIVPTKGSNQP